MYIHVSSESASSREMSSHRIIPNENTSAFSLYDFPLITLGAIQNGLRTTDCVLCMGLCGTHTNVLLYVHVYQERGQLFQNGGLVRLHSVARALDRGGGARWGEFFPLFVCLAVRDSTP